MSSKPKKKTLDGKKSKGGSVKGKGAKITLKDEGRAFQHQQVSAQLTLAEEKLAAVKAEQQAKEAELQHIRSKQENECHTYADVLQHQQREQNHMQLRVRELEQLLGSAHEQLSDMQTKLNANQNAETAVEAGNDEDSKYKRLLLCAEEKGGQICRLQSAVAHLQEQLQQSHESLLAALEQIEDLKYKASSRTKLLLLFDEHCLAQIDIYRLTGKQARLGLGQGLCCTGGRWLLTYGNSHEAGEGTVVNVLDLLTAKWLAPVITPHTQVVSSHTGTSVGNRLITFGQNLGGTDALSIFSPDALSWNQLPTLSTKCGLAPCPRNGSAMSFCSRTNSLFMFGGMAQDDRLLNDLWRLQMDTCEWTQLKTLPNAQANGLSINSRPAMPQPCWNATLASTENGTQLWMFGGSVQGGQCQNTLWRYDIESSSWVLVDPTVDSRYIEPREGHVMTCVRRWLLVAGGSCKQSTGEHKQLSDTHVFDTLVQAWDCIDASCWESCKSVPVSTKAIQLYTTESSSTKNRKQLGFSLQGNVTQVGSAGGCHLDSANCTFVGSSLVILQQSAAGRQDELKVVQLQLPDELAKRRQKRASLVVVEKLEIIETAVTTSSIELAWVPPTKNAHKLVGFKLIATGKDGDVRDVYKGCERTFVMDKLTPATEYIFSVKANYDDASFVWSDSKAVSTLPRSILQRKSLQKADHQHTRVTAEDMV